jgi:hypothetical protein
LPVIFDIDGALRIFFIGWYLRDAQRAFLLRKGWR